MTVSDNYTDQDIAEIKAVFKLLKRTVCVT
jgi:hypothetical protein